MKHLIFDNFLIAQQRNEKAFNDLNCSDPLTTDYSIIKPHPNKKLWAVEVDIKYLHLFTQEEIDSAIELTDDWFNSKSVHCDNCNLDIEIKPFNNRYLAVCDCGNILYNDINLPVKLAF